MVKLSASDFLYARFRLAGVLAGAGSGSVVRGAPFGFAFVCWLAESGLAGCLADVDPLKRGASLHTYFVSGSQLPRQISCLLMCMLVSW